MMRPTSRCSGYQSHRWMLELLQCHSQVGRVDGMQVDIKIVGVTIACVVRHGGLGARLGKGEMRDDQDVQLGVIVRLGL